VCSSAYTIILLDLILYVALVSSTAHSYGSFSWIYSTSLRIDIGLTSLLRVDGQSPGYSGLDHSHDAKGLHSPDAFE